MSIRLLVQVGPEDKINPVKGHCRLCPLALAATRALSVDHQDLIDADFSVEIWPGTAWISKRTVSTSEMSRHRTYSADLPIPARAYVHAVDHGHIRGEEIPESLEFELEFLPVVAVELP